MMSMSALNVFAMSGRWTLTATAFPPFILALWTCATLALPSGRGSMWLNRSLTGFLNSCEMTVSTVCSGSGGTSSCSFANSSQYSCGTRSGLMLNNCPSLTYAPPNSSIDLRNLAGKSTGNSVSPRLKSGRCQANPYLLRIPLSPCFASTRITCVIRWIFSIFICRKPLSRKPLASARWMSAGFPSMLKNHVVLDMPLLLDKCALLVYIPCALC